jgi:ethanolaminephosphotransferase
VYASWAIGLFLYQTFDAVDGTQARRTHQSGPLGELFDHGVDAVNTTLEVLLFSATMNLGQGWKTVLTLFASLLTFYVQTWEEYHTHTLTLGVISGPVEGILTLCIVYAITAVLGGGSFWQRSLLESIGVQNHDFIPDSIYNLAWNEWYMVYGSVVLVFNTLSRYVQVNAYDKET